MKLRFVAVLCAVLFSFANVPAFAADNPTPPPTPAPTAPPGSGLNLPPGLEQAAIDALGNFVKGAFGWSNTEAYGVVTYYRGYDMQVRLQLNRYRDIRLHRGTVINPRGWTISPGQTVDVRGRAQSDGSLYADSIVVLSH